MAYYGWSSGTELYHYGIPGQKWGQRRYQNPDGSLTEEGRARYGRIANRHYAAGRALSGYAKKHSGTRLGNLAAKAAKRQVAIGNSYRSSKSQNARDKKIQKALKIGAGVAGAAALGYGAYRLAKSDTRAGQKIRNTAINARFLGKELGASARGAAANAKFAGERLGAKARSAATKAGIRARELGTSARGAAANARDIAGRAGSRVASKARSLGVQARFLGKELGASARGAAANAGRNIRSAGNKVASKVRNAGIKARYTANTASVRSRANAWNAARSMKGNNSVSRKVQDMLYGYALNGGRRRRK